MCDLQARQLNSFSVNVAGKKDYVFVTGKRKTLDTLPVNSCVVAHVPFAPKIKA